MMGDPYREGFAACREGRTVHENPYATFTTEYARWFAGWRDYDDHQNAKGEALDSIGWDG